METKTSFTQAHLENRLWANELEFYREEIGIYQSHFDEMIRENEQLQESHDADLFQNQLIRYQDQVDQLENELNTAENKMAIYAKAHATTDLDEVNVADHCSFKEKIQRFKQEYQNLKDDFRKFEEKNV